MNRPKTLVKTTNLTREDWLAWRRKGIGSSDSAAVVGLDPWRSPLSVWLDKLGQTGPIAENEYMELGILQEPVVAELFHRRTGWPVRRRNAILQHPQYPWMLANLDRLTQDDTGQWVPLECKTTTQWNEEKWDAGNVPEHYLIQVQHQLGETDASHGYICVLIGGHDVRWVRIDRDSALIEQIMRLEEEFWTSVQQQTPPVARANDTEILSFRYPDSDPELTVFTADDASLIRYWGLHREIKALAEEKDAIANQWRLELGNAETLCVPGQVKPLVTWKSGTSQNFDTQAFKVAYPDLYASFLRTIPTRPLRPRKLKKEESHV